MALALRTPLGLDVIRDRNSLYRVLDDGQVENVYTLKILNKTERERHFDVSVIGAGTLTLDPSNPSYDVGAGEVYPAGRTGTPARLSSRPGPGSIRFKVTAGDNPKVSASRTRRASWRPAGLEKHGHPHEFRN